MEGGFSASDEARWLRAETLFGGSGDSQIKGEEKEMGFDKKVCKELGEEVQVILREALKDSGFDISVGGGRFDDVEFAMKVKFTFANGETRAHRDYREHAALSYTSFPPDMLDATFQYGRLGDVTVLGWMPNRPKMDILLQVGKGIHRNKVAPSASVIQAYVESIKT